MGRACMKKIESIPKKLSRDDGHMPKTWYNTKLAVMSFLIQAQRQCYGSTRRKKWIDIGKWEDFLQKVPLELDLKRLEAIQIDKMVVGRTQSSEHGSLLGWAQWGGMLDSKTGRKVQAGQRGPAKGFEQGYYWINKQTPTLRTKAHGNYNNSNYLLYLLSPKRVRRGISSPRWPLMGAGIVIAILPIKKLRFK